MRQPDPTKGGERVAPWAVAWQARVAQEAQERGLQTYGTELETFNGRNAMADAQEELWDAFMYVSQERRQKEVTGGVALAVLLAIEKELGRDSLAWNGVKAICMLLGVSDE